MESNKEIVTLELDPECRIRLSNEIYAQMEKKHYHSDIRLLGIPGLSADWPIDKDSHPTLAQLILIAQKLNMEIVINGLNLMPRKEPE